MPLRLSERSDWCFRMYALVWLVRREVSALLEFLETQVSPETPVWHHCLSYPQCAPARQMVVRLILCPCLEGVRSREPAKQMVYTVWLFSNQLFSLIVPSRWGTVLVRGRRLSLCYMLLLPFGLPPLPVPACLAASHFHASEVWGLLTTSNAGSVAQDEGSSSPSWFTPEPPPPPKGLL